MELKIFRDTMPQAGTVCTVKAELPLETEILVSDYLPPVFKLVKCFAKPVILQKQLQPGRLTLEGYLRCTVYYQGEDGAGLVEVHAERADGRELPHDVAAAELRGRDAGDAGGFSSGVDNPNTVATFGAGVTVMTKGNLDLTAEYQGVRADGYSAQSGAFKVTWRF